METNTICPSDVEFPLELWDLICVDDPDMELIKIKLESLKRADRECWYSPSPLLAAVMQKNYDLVNHLVKVTKVNVDSVNISDGSGLTALEAAALYDDIKMAKILVNEHKSDPNLITEDTDVCGSKEEWTLLTRTLMFRPAEIIRQLLEELPAIDVNLELVHNSATENMKRSFTALHKAIELNDLEKVQVLMEYKACVSTRGWIRIHDVWKYGNALALAQDNGCHPDLIHEIIAASTKLIHLTSSPSSKDLLKYLNGGHASSNDVTDTKVAVKHAVDRSARYVGNWSKKTKKECVVQ